MHIRLPRLAAVALMSLVVAAMLAVSGAASAAPAPRITGGKPISDADFASRWPFLVSIQYIAPMAKPNDRDLHICGGSLIAPDLVLTAEHCTPANLRAEPLANFKLQVLVGHRTLSTSGVTTVGRVDVTDIWHYDDPLRLDMSGLPQHDVAILKLAHPVSQTPVRIVGAGDRALWGGGEGLASGAAVAGWGITPQLRDKYTSFDGSRIPPQLKTPPTAREVAIPLRADRTCESSNSKMFLDAVTFDRTTMLCAGKLDTQKGPDSNRQGACNGDSGGPLVVPDASGAPVLVGVVSWGSDALGGCNSYSIFTRVDAMRDWIQNMIATQGPAHVAPAADTMTATPVGVNALRVSWTQPAGQHPKHVFLFRDVSWAESLLDLGGFDISPTDVPPSVRGDLQAFKRAHQNVELAGGGPDTTSLLLKSVAPTRPGHVKHVRIHLVTQDANGTLDAGDDVIVDAPVDGQAPTRIAAPKRVSQRGGIVRLWWHKPTDNDCVNRYVVQVGRSSEGPWRDAAHSAAGTCPTASALVTGVSDQGFFGPEFGDYGSRPNEFRTTKLKAGLWWVRVRAYDRAGNFSTGAAALVHVPKVQHGAAQFTGTTHFIASTSVSFDVVGG